MATSSVADLDAAFSSSYRQARERFRAAATQAGFSLAEYVNDRATGPEGEVLATDVAIKGPADADRVVILSSGTHGIEGYCGSGCQVALLSAGEFDVLPSNVRVVLVHALNPYGFAHKRRVNEDNIDLNRNCLDFAAGVPTNTDYEDLHPVLAPEDYGLRPAHWDAQVGEWIKARGFPAFQAAVSSGQYTRSDGLFYGGSAPSWSARTFRRIVREAAGSARDILLMDIHTGLGAFGELEKIGLGNQVAIERARQIWGSDVTNLAGGESNSAPVSGDISVPFFEELPAGAQGTAIALEFGTVDGVAVLKALRLDNWLYTQVDPNTKQDLQKAAEIMATIEAAFYPDDGRWRVRVHDQTRDAVQQALFKS